MILLKRGKKDKDHYKVLIKISKEYAYTAMYPCLLAVKDFLYIIGYIHVISYF